MDYTYDSLLKKKKTTQVYRKTRYNAKKLPIRTAMAAIGLFVLGSVLIYCGWLVGLDQEHRGLSLVILGSIAFIPGSYNTVQLYGAYRRWPGYDYSQIPSYDD